MPNVEPDAAARAFDSLLYVSTGAFMLLLFVIGFGGTMALQIARGERRPAPLAIVVGLILAGGFFMTRLTAAIVISAMSGVADLRADAPADPPRADSPRAAAPPQVQASRAIVHEAGPMPAEVQNLPRANGSDPTYRQWLASLPIKEKGTLREYRAYQEAFHRVTAALLGAEQSQTPNSCAADMQTAYDDLARLSVVLKPRCPPMEELTLESIDAAMDADRRSYEAARHHLWHRSDLADAFWRSLVTNHSRYLMSLKHAGFTTPEMESTPLLLIAERVEKYGIDRIAIVYAPTETRSQSEEICSRLERRLHERLPACDVARSARFPMATTLVVGNVADFDALVKLIDDGTVTGVDAGRRTFGVRSAATALARQAGKPVDDKDSLVANRSRSQGANARQSPTASKNGSTFTLEQYRAFQQSHHRLVQLLDNASRRGASATTASALQAAYAETAKEYRSPIVQFGIWEAAEKERIDAALKADASQYIAAMRELAKRDDLPRECWRAIMTGDAHLVSVQSRQGEVFNDEVGRMSLILAEMIEKYGLDHIAIIAGQFRISPSEAETLFRQRFPACEVKATSEHGVSMLIAGNVDDLDSLSKLIDFGRIMRTDADRRRILVVDLGRPMPDTATSLSESRTAAANGEFERAAARLRDRRQSSNSDTKTADSKSSPPAATDDAATRNAAATLRVDELAALMMDGSPFVSGPAITRLLEIDPKTATPEQRKRIARNFRKLFESENAWHRGEVTRGLVRWGGKYSIPILLAQISKTHSWMTDDVFAVLGDYPDPDAAAIVSKFLGDYFHHGGAYTCLKRMGPVAEDALIQVAPSHDPKVCLAAIELLGESGSEKCLDILRQAQSSSNAEVRISAKTAVRKVMSRRNEPSKTSESADGAVGNNTSASAAASVAATPAARTSGASPSASESSAAAASGASSAPAGAANPFEVIGEKE